MGKSSQEITSDKKVFLREFSSGGVVYKKIDDDLLWLIAKSSTSKLFPNPVWRLPKGWIDDAGKDIPGPMASGKMKTTEKALRETAIREVSEEAGVNAEIVSKIGTQKYIFTHPIRGRIMKFVTFYLMEWRSNVPEGFDNETSEIAWLKYEDAKKQITYSAEKDMLTKASEVLYSNNRI